eukprot:15476428-Alexandrium_andersonii.AAC.1
MPSPALQAPKHAPFRPGACQRFAAGRVAAYLAHRAARRQPEQACPAGWGVHYCRGHPGPAARSL